MIDRYDVRSGWSIVPDPFAGEDNPDEAAERLGFERFTKVGFAAGPSITVLRGKEAYLILFDTESCCERFLAPDLASVVELLSKLTPLVEAAALELLHDEISDLRNLLVGEHGPLEDALITRNLRSRAERDKARAAKQE